MNRPDGGGASHPAGRDIHVEGIVQGVGFRPFVYGLALRHELGGWVLNNSAGVDIRVYGSERSIDTFLRDLAAERPPLAVIDSLDSTPTAQAQKELDRAGGVLQTFAIRESEDTPRAFVPISPDVATCADCLDDLLDPHNRRYRYPFTNCTNCGPRFTIVRDIPYDRPLTTMAEFSMCPACQVEYEDAADRRFHAQPNACAVCGPQLTLIASPRARDVPGLTQPLVADAALSAARALLDAGVIVAIKGLGGYHLACNAADQRGVRELRRRKGRIDKPFAVMAPDLDSVRSFAVVNDADAALLTSRQSPIVLLPKRNDCWLAGAVAPANPRVGVMLPYTPLHHLLLERIDAEGRAEHRPPVFVMTSGNLSEEPIVKDNNEALDRLGELADAFLMHDRAIHIHCDDSVMRTFRGLPMPIRRARGYAPAPIRLPAALSPVLAVGGELKNTFCLTNGRYAFMSQHIGDMGNLETLSTFERTVNHYTRIFRVEPEVVACDMHPRYLSTRWASEYAQKNDLPLIAVQHHHAHIAACMAEHNVDPSERVIGVSLDGTGYGPDNTIWGGELLIAGYADFERVGRIRPVPLPGGDAAIKRPYRIALAYLWDAELDWDAPLPPVQAAADEELRILRRQLEVGLNTTLTSSMGRLFDAVSALTGVRQTITYEAQAAMELEALAERYAADHGPVDPYDYTQIPYTPQHTDPDRPVPERSDGPKTADNHTAARCHSERSEETCTPDAQTLRSTQGDTLLPLGLQFEFDTRPLIRQVTAEVARGVPPQTISARFHATVAAYVCDACCHIRRTTGIERVALSGGVFQNGTLLAMVVDLLEQEGFRPLVHSQVPANDGGIALGQALIAHYSKAQQA